MPNVTETALHRKAFSLHLRPIARAYMYSRSRWKMASLKIGLHFGTLTRLYFIVKNLVVYDAFDDIRNSQI